MNFGTAISTVFRNYVNFRGRASRPEFWWWFLFTIIVNIVLNIIATALPGGGKATFEIISYLWSLAILLPYLAVGARRLHDGNHSAFHLFWYLLPFIGWIILIILWAQPTNPAAARFGQPDTSLPPTGRAA
jgi:uncharacterized membrane protein YhaH (DUF805 family)